MDAPTFYVGPTALLLTSLEKKLFGNLNEH